MQKETLIINLFELYQGEALTICNIIVTTLQQQIDLIIKLKNKMETELMPENRQGAIYELANILISKFNPTNQVRYFL